MAKLITQGGVLERTFVLTGARMGKTITLGKKFDFVNGRYTARGTSEELKNVQHLLGKFYSAVPEGDPKIQESKDGQRKIYADRQNAKRGEQVGSGVQLDEQVPSKETTPEEQRDGEAASGGEGDIRTSGDGHERATETLDPELQKIRNALMRLDPENPEHWNATGDPRIDVIAAFTGNQGIVRKNIKAAYPQFNRETAKALKKDAA